VPVGGEVAANHAVGRLSVKVDGNMSQSRREGCAEAAWGLPELGDPIRGRSIAIPLGHDGSSSQFVPTKVHH
jgi:hypothetical protein